MVQPQTNSKREQNDPPKSLEDKLGWRCLWEMIEKQLISHGPNLD